MLFWIILILALGGGFRRSILYRAFDGPFFFGSRMDRHEDFRPGPRYGGFWGHEMNGFRGRSRYNGF